MPSRVLIYGLKSVTNVVGGNDKYNANSTFSLCEMSIPKLLAVIIRFHSLHYVMFSTVYATENSF